MDIKTVLVSTAAAIAASAVTVPVMVSFVTLQATSPGTPELGNTSVTGNSIAGRFGAGTTPTLARVQVNETGPLQGVRVATTISDAINAFSSAATGGTVTGRFTNSSASGKSVLGDSISATGNSIGGDFKSRSTTGGFGILARHIATSGPGIGVSGSSASPNGSAGVFNNTNLNNGAVIGGPTGSLLTKGERPRHKYTVGTSATMVPLAYGVVFSDGTLGPGTGNFTVTRASAGRYDIDVQGITFNTNNGIVVATPFDNSGDQTATVSSPVSGDIRINSFNVTSNALADTKFYFVVYLAEESVLGPQWPDSFPSPPQLK